MIPITDIKATDTISRPPISGSIKKAINDAFLIVPEGKNSAIVAIYDFETKDARVHFAYKVNDTWKVGAQVGWTVNKKPMGYVGVEAAW